MTATGVSLGFTAVLLCFFSGYWIMNRQGDGDKIIDAGNPTSTAASAPDAGHFVLTEPVRIDMIFVSPGTFIMGTPPGEEGHEPDETRHEVTLTRPYFLGRTEVTQAQWKKIMGDNPSVSSGDDLPVENVTYAQVEQFCKSLSARTGKRFRLPTEAEWEYACRAGTEDAYQGKARADVAWDNHPAASAPHPVATKAPNAWGFYDMLCRNVWELCSDYYAEYPAGAAEDPRGPPAGTNHVNRGGAFQDDSNMGAAASSVPWRSGNRASASPVGSSKPRVSGGDGCAVRGGS